MTEIGNFIVAHWETLLGVLLLLLATDGIAGYLPDKWVPYVGAVKRVAQILLTRFGKGVPIILAMLMLSGCAGMKSNLEETGAPMAIPPPPGLSSDGARGIRVEGAVAIGTSALRDNAGTMQVSNGGGAYQNIGTATASISDVAYPTGWNTDTVNGASRNAVYGALQAFLPISQIGAAYDTEAELAALLASHPHQDVGTAANPSFASVHASGGNLAAANRQVVKAWQTGLPYVADLTAVVYGGTVYVCTSSHTAGSTTEPGVGASWETVWAVVSGTALTDLDDLPGDTVDDNAIDIGLVGGITAFGESLIDDDNATEARSTLGLGAIATYGVGTLTDTYVCVYSTASGIVCNTNPSTFGGGYTNLTDFDAQTAYRIFYSDANGDTTELALGADGEYLKSNGASAAPSWATPSGAAHDAVTLSTDLGNNLLGLSTQQITLDNQTANYIFAGPATGAAAAPAFRAMVDADIPSAIARDTELHAAVTIGSGIGGITLSTQELSLATRLEAYHDYTDPNADRIWFWDDSAGAFAGLTVGTGLDITGTTLTATGGTDTIGWDYTVRTAAPASPVAGKVYRADNDTWDPITYAGTTDYFVLYTGSAYIGIVDLAGNLLIDGIPVSALDVAANVATFLGSADYAAMRTNMGLVISTNVQAYDADLTTWAGVTPGAGVATAAAQNLSAAGGLTTTARSGSVTFNPTSVASGACSGAVDGGTATGVATTDVIVWNPSTDPTSTTGYNPAGDLGFIWAYPTADHVNFKFCNKSGNAIDPGSITINWKVVR